LLFKRTTTREGDKSRETAGVSLGKHIRFMLVFALTISGQSGKKSY